MDSTVFLSLSLSRWKNREKKKRKRRRRRRRTLRGFERGSPTNYLLRYDLPRLCSCLSPAEWAFKLPREIKLLRVSSRYYTHAPPIDSPPLPALLYPFWIRCAYNIKKPLWFRTINKIRGWTPPLIRSQLSIFLFSIAQPNWGFVWYFEVTGLAGSLMFRRSDVCFEVFNENRRKMKIVITIRISRGKLR